MQSKLKAVNENDKVTSFKDLIVWQKSSQLFINIDNDVKLFPKNITAKVIEEQIIRSSSSISANIAEGFGRYKGKEFIRFLLISRGSTTETQDWLIKAFKLGFIDELKYKSRFDECNQIIKIINTIISRLRAKA